MKLLAPCVCLVATTVTQGVFAAESLDAYRRGDYITAANTLPSLSGKDPVADYYLARMRLYGYGQLKNNAIAIRHYKMAAEKGYLAAQQIMGRYSLLVDNNPEQAFLWFKKAAENNDINAQMYCAAACLYGLGVKKNVDQAKKFITAAAKNGNGIAQYTLAMDFINSKHSENKKLGLIWLNKAVAQGNVKAQVELASLLYKGEGVDKDVERAKVILKEPLEKNYIPALLIMGDLALSENNTALAHDWYLKAAELNNTKAQLTLSNLYYQTNSPLFDPRQGYQWLLKAAQEDDEEAQLSLAKLYREGRFVPRDLELAKEWETKANNKAGNGNFVHLEKEIAQWLSNDKETTITAAGYQLPGIFSDWHNKKALRENTYNLAPQMQELTQKELYKPQFTMVTPNEIPINEFYNALAQNYGEIKDTFTTPTYALEPAQTSTLNDIAFNRYDFFNFKYLEKKQQTPIQELYDQAILGDPSSQFALGQHYQYGIGTAKNIEKAIKFYQLAADQGDLKSMYTMGMLYLEGKGIAPNYSLAQKWLGEAAFKGNVFAQYILAGLYKNGLKDGAGKFIIKPNVNQAESLYFLASFNDFGPAQYVLAELLTRNDPQKSTFAEQALRQHTIKRLFASAVKNGVREAQVPLAFFNAMESDPMKQAQAFEVAKKAAEQGNGEAALLLGLLYDRGLSVPADQNEALKWYQQAPKNLVTSFILGTYASEGRVFDDKQKGKALLEEAAQADFSYADLNLGILKHNENESFLPNLQKAQALGNAKAAILLADSYLSNSTESGDLKQAREIYQNLAEKGDKEGQVKLAYMFENGLGGASDLPAAQNWYTQAAQNGQQQAAFLLGRMYQLGKIENHPNYEEAKKWYGSIKETYAPAAIALGFIQETVEDNYLAAAHSYQFAATAENAVGEYNLGLIYQDGKGTPVNFEKAKTLFEKSAEKDHPQAMTALARLYVNNSITPEDEQKGYLLIKKAASDGDRDALYHLGLLAETGVGTDVNLEEAVQSYQQGVALGDVKAMLALARMYQYGFGVEKSKQKAEELYKTAADKNDPYAQYQLATFYFDGISDNKIPEQTKRLLQQAEENGSIQARIALQWMNAHSKVQFSYITPVPSNHVQQIAELPANLLYLDAINEWNRGNVAFSRKILDHIITQYPQFAPAKRAVDSLDQEPGLLGFKQFTQLSA